MRLEEKAGVTRTFPFIPEKLVTFAQQSTVGKRLMKAVETAVYRPHVVREDRIARDVETSLNRLIDQAHYAPHGGSEGFTRSYLRSELQMRRLRFQLGGVPSERLISTVDPQTGEYTGHIVEVMRDVAGREVKRHLFSTREHNPNGRHFRDSIDFYKNSTLGELVIVYRDENLSSRDDPGHIRSFSTAIRFAPNGDTLLVHESSERVAHRRGDLSRKAVVVNKDGAKLHKESEALQLNPRYLLKS